VPKKKLFNINFVFSGCVIGTPVYFGGMTGRGRAVILKFNFSKSCDHKKINLLGHSVRNLNVHPVHTYVLFICLSSARQLKCLHVSKTDSYGISRICFEMTCQATMPSSSAEVSSRVQNRELRSQ
jgi:hypothetical protein